VLLSKGRKCENGWNYSLLLLLEENWDLTEVWIHTCQSSWEVRLARSRNCAAQQSGRNCLCLYSGTHVLDTGPSKGQFLMIALNFLRFLSKSVTDCFSRGYVLMGERKLLSAFCLSLHFVTAFGSSRGQTICLQRATKWARHWAHSVSSSDNGWKSSPFELLHISFFV